MDDDHQFLTVQDAADLSRLSTRTIRDQIKDGRLPATLLGGPAGWRIRRSDYITWADRLLKEGKL